MRIAIATFEGFNEIDSFVALNILNRVRRDNWKAEIVAPSEYVTSMNGVVIKSQQPFSFINQADAVLFGSGTMTRTVAKDKALMSQINLDPSRQLIGSQCSGALILKQLGLVENTLVCTDSTTAPWLIEAGAQVIKKAFSVEGNIATAGGCLSSQYLAAWIIHRQLGSKVMTEILSSVAPVGEENSFTQHILSVTQPSSNDINTEPKSFLEAARDVIGIAKGPGNLISNPDYMDGYGQ